MDQVGCMSCGHTAEAAIGGTAHCPECGNLLEPISGDGAWTALRQRTEAVRFSRAAEHRRLQLARAARQRLAPATSIPAGLRAR